MMNPKSAKALLGAAAISLVLGMVVISPAGGLFLYGLAALLALAPIFGGDKKVRIAAGVLLALALVLLATTYPEYAKEMARYREHAEQKRP